MRIDQHVRKYKKRNQSCEIYAHIGCEKKYHVKRLIFEEKIACENRK